MSAYIEKAREGLEMAQPDYKRVMAYLVTAVDKCPQCTNQDRHGKDKECHIKQCTRAIMLKKHDKPIDFDFPCSCGFAWPRCSSPDHVQALDLLADTLQCAEQWIQAVATAMGLVRLDPRSPVGYYRVAMIISSLLRVNKVAKESGTPDFKAARAITTMLRCAGLSQDHAQMVRHIAQKFVSVGLRHVTHPTLNTTSTTFNHARALQLMGHRFGVPESKRDPAKVLPIELYQTIVSYLDPTARSRSLRVNRNWRDLIIKSPTLWVCLDIPKPYQMSDSVLASFLNKHLEIQTLIFRNLDKFKGRHISPRKFSILLALPSLKRLILPNASYPLINDHLTTVKFPPKLHLTQLCLCSCSIDHLIPMLTLTRDTLQVLHLLASPSGVDEVIENIPMPRLRILGITGEQFGPPRSRLPLGSISIVSLAKATPNLQEFLLDRFRLYRRSLEGERPISEYWKSLRAITLGDKLVFQGNPLSHQLFPRCFPPPTESMERIDILTTDPAIVHNYLFTVDFKDHVEHPTLYGERFRGVLPVMPNLHTFRCRVAIETQLLRRILELPASKLRVLELTILPTVGLLNSMVYRPPIPATGIGKPDEVLSWLRCENLEHVGLYNFNFSTNVTSSLVSLRFDGAPFTRWIEDNLPKVESVAVYPGAQPDAHMYVLSLILHPRRFKVIWEDAIPMTALDLARQEAQSAGVILKRSPANRPHGPDALTVSEKDHWDVIYPRLWDI